MKTGQFLSAPKLYIENENFIIKKLSSFQDQDYDPNDIFPDFVRAWFDSLLGHSSFQR